MTNSYDAIVVGARCAGSPTAMLLARKGYRVLVVDRASFPSDTVSTHFDPRPGRRGAEPLGTPRPGDRVGLPARRHLLVRLRPRHDQRARRGRTTASRPRTRRAARCSTRSSSTRPRRAGAEVREHFTARGGRRSRTAPSSASAGTAKTARSVVERARVVIGADGRNSHVAKAVEPEQYNEKPMLMWAYYTYWSGLPVDGFSTTVRPDRGWAAFPTNDGLTLLVVGWPNAEATAYKSDVEANYLKTLELAPEFAERMRGAKREARFAGGAVPNFFRKPYGPGWALVGDAGYTKDPITARGHHRRVPRRRAVRRRVRTRPSRGDASVRRRDGRLPAHRATRTRCRSTSSRPNSRRWSRRRPRCSNCSARCTATRTRWTCS